MQAVRDSEELRKAVEEVQPLQVRFGLRLAQSQPLYKAFQALRDGPEWAALSEARKRVVENELRDFVLGGVALEVCAHLVIFWNSFPASLQLCFVASPWGLVYFSETSFEAFFGSFIKVLTLNMAAAG